MDHVLRKNQGAEAPVRAIFKDIVEFRWFILFLTASVALVTAAVVYHWPDQFSASVELYAGSADNSLPFEQIKNQKILTITPLQGSNIFVISASAPSSSLANKIIQRFCRKYSGGKVKVLRNIPAKNVPYGPDRLFYLCFSVMISLVMVCFYISIRSIFNLKGLI